MGHRGGMWVVAQAVLLLLFALAPAMGPRWPMHGIFQLAGWLLAGIGSLLLVSAAVNLGRSLTPFPRPLSDAQLVTAGVYRYVRHPMYCALLIGALGLSLATESVPRLACTGILFVFFDLKARREERWLEQQYPAYAAYKTRVRKLIPWLY
ncbi:MAG: protein-S-isoprenylcysteine O-methyltransferase Ste14 [Janthinobacterium sp.]|jgi:protein-S-isoprenylcysteine O-methyltransferase Ste14